MSGRPSSHRWRGAHCLLCGIERRQLKDKGPGSTAPRVWEFRALDGVWVVRIATPACAPFEGAMAVTDRREDSIRVRVSVAQKAALTRAAVRAGLGVSTWLLALGLREAEKQGSDPIL